MMVERYVKRTDNCFGDNYKLGFYTVVRKTHLHVLDLIKTHEPDDLDLNLLPSLSFYRSFLYFCLILDGLQRLVLTVTLFYFIFQKLKEYLRKKSYR